MDMHTFPRIIVFVPRFGKSPLRPSPPVKLALSRYMLMGIETESIAGQNQYVGTRTTNLVL